MKEYYVYDKERRPYIYKAESLDNLRANLMKKYSKVAYELTSFKIATRKNDASLGELRYDLVLGWKWVSIERAHKVILRYTNVYLVNKDGSLGKKLGNAYRV